MFAPFLQSVGATDIRAFEEGQLRDVQEHYKARMKMQQHRAKLEVSMEQSAYKSLGPCCRSPVEVVAHKMSCMLNFSHLIWCGEQLAFPPSND